ncbi:MAG: asparagine synthase (glutamine-hydrolyzing) [Bauldia sp.]|nr:asparagine synthase (glutamine-hydrolyzing) [Bauldia sp.]
MCGINGIFAYNPAANPPDEAELLRTRDAMAARGPDGAGAWWSDDRRCALGHRRLAIIDTSAAGAQPMTSFDGSLTVTFNGEIYNYPELRRALEAEGARFRSRSDTEVLLHLYRREGAAMVKRLRGMYAFAIHDEARGGVFLARDPYGIKPLYVADDGWTMRFASQVKAILAGGAVSFEPEPAGIVGFHLFGSVPEPFTLYRAIRSLPAGHTQWIDAAGSREPRPFASIAAVLAEGRRRAGRADEVAARVRAAVGASVGAHLLADVEVGVFLSAGIDSGAILGLTREAGQSRRAITLTFDEFRGTPADEAPLAVDIARRYGAEHVVRSVGRAEFEADLPAITAAMDQPSIDGVNTWFVAKSAREVGLKVALSGVGGDELLAGYPSFRDVPRWRRRFGPLAAAPGAGVLARRILAAAAPRLASDNPKALGLVEHSGSWGGAYLLRRGLFLPHELDGFLDREIVRDGLARLDIDGRFRASLRPDPGSDVGRVTALESAFYLRNQLLRDADWAGMAHGLEIRTPLVDYALLTELASVLPRFGGGVGKAALAAAPSPALPDSVAARAKTGFEVPVRQWMRSTAESGGARTSRGAGARSWAHFVFGRAAATGRAA